jgi:hypothetical protein
MQVCNGFITLQSNVADGTLVLIVTELAPDQPSGSRTATVLIRPNHMHCLMASLEGYIRDLQPTI